MEMILKACILSLALYIILTSYIILSSVYISKRNYLSIYYMTVTIIIVIVIQQPSPNSIIYKIEEQEMLII